MKIAINAYEAKERFIAINRDYYSIEGLEALLEFYDEIDENLEFDPIAICCECAEYEEDELISYYSDYYPLDEFLEENEISKEELDKYEYIESLVEKLVYYTIVLQASNGNYIVFNF